jgi:hypothetical protein
MPREKIRSRMPPGNRYAISSPKAAPMSAPTMRMTMKAAAPPGFLASVLPSSCRQRFRCHAAGSMDAVMKAQPMQGGKCYDDDGGPKCLTRASASAGIVNAAGMTCVSSP